MPATADRRGARGWGVKRFANLSRIGDDWAFPVSNARRPNATMGDGVFLFSSAAAYHQIGEVLGLLALVLDWHYAGACDLALS